MIAIGSGDLALTFDTDSGTFDVFFRSEPVVRKARPHVVFRTENGLLRASAVTPYKVIDTGPHALKVESTMHGCGFSFSAEIRGKRALFLTARLSAPEDGPPVSVESIVPVYVPPGCVLSAKGSLSDWRFYQNGWQCWTPSGTVKATRPGSFLYPLFLPKMAKPMLANTATPITMERGSFKSEWFAGVADVAAGRSVVIGFAGVDEALGQVSFNAGRAPSHSSLEASEKFEGKSLGKGESLECDPLAIVPGDLSPENFEVYADLVAEETGVSEVRHAPLGWCSWYHYFTGITEEEVRKNLGLISDKLDRFGIEVVQIDDGYQKTLGDWLETSDAFPSGMETLAGEIRSRGRIPGIWLAPFAVMRNSWIFREKREWLIRDGKGRPVLAGVSPMWKWRFYGLDTTHPEVLDWLSGLFREVVRRGYRYIKLDFLATGLLEGKRHDPSLTRAQAMRRALKVIREVVGDDVYLLAAGGGFMLGAGILDAQRIGGDVAPFWLASYQRLIRDRSTPSTRNALIYLFTRSFLSGRLFEGDPDCMMLRTKKTKLNDIERKCLASAIACFGGALVISDDLALLSGDELDLLERMIPHVNSRPRCPDIWREEIPCLLASKLYDPFGEYHNVLFVNWSESEASKVLRFQELGLEEGYYYVHEYWSGSYLGRKYKEFEVHVVPPHGAAVFRLTPARGEFRIIGSSLHICQGAAEIVAGGQDGRSAWVRVFSPAKRKAFLVCCCPGAGDLKAVPRRGDVADFSLEEIAEDIYRVSFSFEGECEMTFNW